ncbi:MAG: hypothetical protein HY906_26325 [Deltaproteobacteria bacterium]|nr:hypothetical protein [Deltaproteobacteria bacterium]
MRVTLAVAIAGAALLHACRPSFEPATWVDGFRVLTVKAEPPEIAVGETTTLSVLAVDTAGGPVSVSWALCLLPPNPATGESVSRDCLTTDADAALLPLGAGLSTTLVMPDEPAINLGQPDSTGGVYVPVRLEAEGGGKLVAAVYRLRYGHGTVPNQNPVIAGVYLVPAGASDASVDALPALDETTPPEVRAGDVLTLRAAFTPESAETYEAPEGGDLDAGTAPKTELLSATWFATAGRFSVDTTGTEKPDTVLKLDAHLPAAGTDGALIDLWVVGRDDRGGVDHVHRTLLLR